MQLSLLKILPRFPVLKVKSLNKASTLIEFYFFLYFVIANPLIWQIRVTILQNERHQHTWKYLKDYS
jgi:hypothetical protein